MAIDLGITLIREFGESVVYTPVTGAARTITAIVDRRPQSELRGVARGGGPLLEVTVANGVADGISSAELNTGGDQITVAARVGGTAEAFAVNRIIEHDAHAMKLELR